MRTIFARGLAFVILAGASPPEPPGDVPTAKSIAEDLEVHGVKKAHLLAFKAQVDDRPLFVESALVAIEREAGAWRLVHAYRHPKEPAAGRPRWHLSVVYDAAVDPSEDFDHKPTKAEVERFLKGSWWEFRPSVGFRLVRGEVFAKAWEEALGYKPEHRFPDPDH